MADTIKIIPSFVQGNTTILAVKPKWEDMDAKGGKTLTDADLTKVSGMSVSVVTGFGKRYEMDYRLIDDNTFSIDLVDLPVGLYGLEVKCIDEEGLKRRFYAAPGEWVRIVSPTSAAEIPTDGTVNSMYDMSIVFSIVGAVANNAAEINTAKKTAQEAIVAAKAASDTASKAASDAQATAEKYDKAYKDVTKATETANISASLLTDVIKKIPYVEEDANSDLDIVDEKSNILVRFKDGNIKTKNFDSSETSSTGYNMSYSGMRIDVTDCKFKAKMSFMLGIGSPQGCAAYDGKMFQFHNTNNTVEVYDLKDDGALLQSVAMFEVNEQYHCNNVNFGNEFYSPSDTFPLLYVSFENAAQHKVFVYRVVVSKSTYSLSKVQTITLPVPSDDTIYYPNAFIDCERNLLVCGGLGNSSWSKNSDNELKYAVFELPKLSSGDVTLKFSDKLDSFSLKNYPTTQGGFIRNSKLYQVFGMSTNSELHVFDIATHQDVSQLSFSQTFNSTEPESCFLFDGSLYVVFVDSKVYKLDFK